MVSPTPTVFRHQDRGTSPQGESCFQIVRAGKFFGTYLNHEHFAGASAGCTRARFMFLPSLCGWRLNRFVRNQPVRVRLPLLLVGIAAMAGSWVARPQAQATCPCTIWSLS